MPLRDWADALETSPDASAPPTPPRRPLQPSGLAHWADSAWFRSRERRRRAAETRERQARAQALVDRYRATGSI